MIDIKHNQDGHIDISSGDIVYSRSTEQHQRDLLICDKGHLKEKPEAGVGAANYINDEDPESFLRLVRREFIADGMTVIKVGMNSENLNIDADYKDN